jgi:hypothetical protein
MKKVEITLKITLELLEHYRQNFNISKTTKGKGKST